MARPVQRIGNRLGRFQEAEGMGEIGVARALARHRLTPEPRSEEHTSELQSLMRNSTAVFCLKNKYTTYEDNILHNLRATIDITGPVPHINKKHKNDKNK